MILCAWGCTSLPTSARMKRRTIIVRVDERYMSHSPYATITYRAVEIQYNYVHHNHIPLQYSCPSSQLILGADHFYNKPRRATAHPGRDGRRDHHRAGRSWLRLPATAGWKSSGSKQQHIFQQLQARRHGLRFRHQGAHIHMYIDAYIDVCTYSSYKPKFEISEKFFISTYIHLHPISVSIFHLFCIPTWTPPQQGGNALSTVTLLWQKLSWWIQCLICEKLIYTYVICLLIIHT